MKTILQLWDGLDWPHIKRACGSKILQALTVGVIYNVITMWLSNISASQRWNVKFMKKHRLFKVMYFITLYNYLKCLFSIVSGLGRLFLQYLKDYNTTILMSNIYWFFHHYFYHLCLFSGNTSKSSQWHIFCMLMRKAPNQTRHVYEPVHFIIIKRDTYTSLYILS